MNITITASLTDEQVEILSNAKGYQPTVSEMEIVDGIPTVISTISNPQSRADFIAEQYKGLVNADAQNEYIRYAKKQREDSERAEEEAIRANVTSALTYSVE